MSWGQEPQHHHPMHPRVPFPLMTAEGLILGKASPGDNRSQQKSIAPKRLMS